MKAMDNFRVEVTSRGKADLRRALKLVFEAKHDDLGDLTVPDRVSGVRGLVFEKATGAAIFYWHMDDKVVDRLKSKGLELVTIFPWEMKGDVLLEFVWQFLQENNSVDPEPDLDGHCTKGWHLIGGDVDHDGWSYACLKIRPVWAWHHK